MPSEEAHPAAPGLSTYLKSLKSHQAEASVEQLISLLKRRQIRGSRPCAIAVTRLYLKLIAEIKFKDVGELLERVRGAGSRLSAAQPHELVIGNISRRVLGLIREVTETGAEINDGSQLDQTVKPLPYSPSKNIQSSVKANSPAKTDAPLSMRDLKQDVLNGLREMLEELDQADEQVAGYAIDHIRANETILTFTSSLTVQRFLLSAAKKRKITVIHVEGYPNEIEATRETILNGKTKRDAEDASNDNRLKSLTAAGVTVILVPDSAVYAVMAQVDTVVLPLHIGLPNGGFIGAAGCRIIAQAAKAHKVPVITLGAIYKLSPLYPYEPDALTEMGDPGKVLDYRQGDLIDHVEAINPISDYVPPEVVDLFITNIGPFPPSFIYRIVADHYRDEDVDI